MFTNGNLAAPLSALSFLGAGLLILMVGLVLVYSSLKQKMTLKRIALAAVVTVGGSYLGVMLLFSFRSTEQLLARGQEKYFCEIDCHLAYSVKDLRETNTLGNMPNQIQAPGTFRLVTIQTRFDPETIRPQKPSAPLTPNARIVSVHDENGNVYFPSPEGQRILDLAQAAGTPMTTPLGPGQTYTTSLVFDLPVSARTPTLLIQEGDFITRLLIGHENSPLHKKTRFLI